MQIKFGFDEIKSDGQHCTRCGELITGKLFIPFVQVGDAADAEYIEDRQICQLCKNEVWPDK